jgi:hypothetical protein
LKEDASKQYASEREATRFEHLAELQKVYGFRQFSTRDYRELSAWLLPLALSTDAGPTLVGALIEEIRDLRSPVLLQHKPFSGSTCIGFQFRAKIGMAIQELINDALNGLH